jgi:hypothetical protein
MSDKPTFTKAALETLDECRAIVDQRAGEYEDSWATANQVTPFLDNMLKTFNVTLTKEQKRLVLLASMCDVKVSRLVGPFKTDTVVDLINYSAALASLHDEYKTDSEATPDKWISGGHESLELYCGWCNVLACRAMYSNSASAHDLLLDALNLNNEPTVALTEYEAPILLNDGTYLYKTKSGSSYIIRHKLGSCGMVVCGFCMDESPEEIYAQAKTRAEQIEVLKDLENPRKRSDKVITICPGSGPYACCQPYCIECFSNG